LADDMLLMEDCVCSERDCDSFAQDLCRNKRHDFLILYGGWTVRAAMASS
jgi:hypothetical protein